MRIKCIKICKAVSAVHIRQMFIVICISWGWDSPQWPAHIRCPRMSCPFFLPCPLGMLHLPKCFQERGPKLIEGVKPEETGWVIFELLSLLVYLNDLFLASLQVLMAVLGIMMNLTPHLVHMAHSLSGAHLISCVWCTLPFSWKDKQLACRKQQPWRPMNIMCGLNEYLLLPN